MPRPLCLPHLLWPRCVRCGGASPLPLCRACQVTPLLLSQRAEGLDVWALAPYRAHHQLSATADLVRRLKYAEQTCSAASLGWALARHWPAPLEKAVLVPVPLHPARLVERGYNQSALLAGAVARYSGGSITWNDSVLRRSVGGTAQAKLNRDARMQNLTGSFRAQPAPRAGPPVVLIDDVVTTGATLTACAAALSQAGHQVAGAVCCTLAA